MGPQKAGAHMPSVKKRGSNSPTSNNKPRAYSYVRFSTPEQKLGHSLRRQIEGARAFAAEHGLELDESFKDEGVSAFRGMHRNERAALGAFLKAVETGQVAAGSYLIVESLDRLSREEVIDALELFLSLTRNGIIVVTLSDKQIYSRETLRAGPTLLIVSIVELMRSHEESARKSDRVGKAWARKRELAETEKLAMTGRCPGWMRLVGSAKDGTYELIEDRAAIVRSMFADAIAGLGKRAIQTRLNKARIPTWGPGKKKPNFWYESYIGKILSNPATYGQFTPLGKLAGGSDLQASAPIEDYFPAAIDKDTFWAAQASIKSRHFGQGKPGARRNLLTGLVRCSNCGSNMVLIDKRSKGSELVLKCGRAHASAGCDQRKTFSYLQVERQAVWGLGGVRRQSLVEAANTQQSDLSEALAGARAHRDELQRGFDNLMNLAQATGSTRLAVRIQSEEAALDAAEDEVKRRERALQASRPEEISGATESIEQWMEIREKAGQDEQALAGLRRKLALLISHIVIGDGSMVVVHRDGKFSRSYLFERGKRHITPEEKRAAVNRPITIWDTDLRRD